jgi:hypothetical protein
MINLVNRGENKWMVSYLRHKEVFHEKFDTIELAAEFMLALGISDDEIDKALVELAYSKKSTAIFSADGKFEIVGI